MRTPDVEGRTKRRSSGYAAVLSPHRPILLHLEINNLQQRLRKKRILSKKRERGKGNRGNTKSQHIHWSNSPRSGKGGSKSSAVFPFLIREFLRPLVLRSSFLD